MAAIPTDYACVHKNRLFSAQNFIVLCLEILFQRKILKSITQLKSQHKWGRDQEVPSLVGDLLG